MIRIKLVKNSKHGKTGDVIVVSKNEAFGLIDSGYAVISKDMTPDDYKQAGDTDGKFTQLRSHKSK